MRRLAPAMASNPTEPRGVLHPGDLYSERDLAPLQDL